MIDLPTTFSTSRPQDMAASLSVTQLNLRLVLDPRLDAGFDLVARLRGAWGHALLGMAQSGQAEAISARAAFFADKVGAAGHATPPYRIAAQAAGDELHISLALIGFAGRWRDAAFDAMVAALTQPPGLLLDWRSGRQVPLHLLSADWTRSEGVCVPEVGRFMVMDFKTPLRVGPSGALGTSFDDVLVGLAERCAGLCAWTGLTFEPRLSWWRDRARALSYDSADLTPVVWDMYSSKNGRTKAAGYVGKLVIHGADEDVVALLSAGTVLHAGGSPSKGCGRYELYPRPW